MTRSEMLEGTPPEAVVPHARERIKAANEDGGPWVVVLDDDPTGSQAVHDVPVLTAWGIDDLGWAFEQPSHGFFILTNTRGLGADETRGLLTEVVGAVERAAAGRPYTLLARSDSTLRGHYPLETDVLAEQKRSDPYDAVLIVPAYLPAGRVTADDVHWVADGERYEPVGSTVYAKDATFGFVSSDLKDYVEEKTAGRVKAGDVLSIGLADIRLGGPSRVEQILASARNAAPVVVNAVDESDLDAVVLGVIEAEKHGVRVLARTGPSFAAARLGIAPREPLRSAEVFRTGRGEGHGLIVVGSHVDLSTRQLARLREDLPDVRTIELDVPRLLDPSTQDEEVLQKGDALVEALRGGDAVLATSRVRVTGETGASSLSIAQAVSAALTGISGRAVAEVPVAWVLAKGGITSSDVATRGLGIRRATVAGQLFPGIVSVWVTESSDDSPRGLPYVVFAGNVGDDESLLRAVHVLRGDGDPPDSGAEKSFS
ncbi:four-carbon acid sugar kinase family protein [Amnibacterium endophyticum]|uniref:Four-carbon acid sugar kinase family protein n=1 Tax=Amnibacterium endophyticum TaxID=2109337 RepID=A0ABW4LJN2_9MICO